MSDHFSPWLTEQGHAPYAWSVLGAVAHATSRVDLMTYVTCPTMRYHPAVVAQKARRCSCCRGPVHAGAGQREPQRARRRRRLARRRDPPRDARRGGRDHPGAAHRRLITYRGDHFDVDSARIWDLPEIPVELGRGRGRPGHRAAGPAGDHLVAVEPDAGLIESWNAVEGARRVGPSGAKAIGQVPICWDPDEKTAVTRAHEQFRWFAGGWSVNADLPTPAGFAAASQYVRPEDVAESIPCGPDLDRIVEAVGSFWEAGFTDVALVQVEGDSQDAFLEEAAGPLLEKLRAARRDLAEVLGRVPDGLPAACAPCGR